MRISDWSSDVCSSDLIERPIIRRGGRKHEPLLELDRKLGLVVDDDRVEDFRAHRHLESRGSFGAGLLLAILADPRPVSLTTSAIFLGDVPALVHTPVRIRTADKRAAAPAAHKRAEARSAG